MKASTTTLNQHLAYARYVIRHKCYVLRACRRTGTSLWRGLVHDLSKFLPSEWGPYAKTFYRPDGTSQYHETEEFNVAWLRHQRRNPHHWQAWLLVMDRGDILPMRMPMVYVREMIADWIGAGLAITGKMEVREWYSKSKDNMKLHPETRQLVEDLLVQVQDP